MKKIFFAMFFSLIFATNSLTCHANITRVADVGAENLYQTLQTFLQVGVKQANMSLVAAKLFRAPNGDDTQYGLSAWACYYGLTTSSEPDGEVLFSVNGEGYVSALKVISYSSQKKDTAAFMLVSCLGALGLTADEARQLLNNLEGDNQILMSRIWSSAKNRYFLLMAAPRMQSAEGFQFMIAADDGRK